MPLSVWVRHAATVFAFAAAMLAAVRLLKGDGVPDALSFGVGWAAASTALFIATRAVRSRRGEACALCPDTPAPAAAD